MIRFKTLCNRFNFFPLRCLAFIGVNTPFWSIVVFIIYSFLEYVNYFTLFWSMIYKKGFFMYGKILKEIRLEHGLTQAEFAKIIGTTQKNISKYELEFLDLSTETIIAICKNFNVSADYLLGLEDETGTKVYENKSYNNFDNRNNSGNINIKF